MRPVTPPRRHRLLSTLLLVPATALTVIGTTGSAQASPRSSYIVLVPGDHGSRVVALQRYLQVRPASGYYGTHTRQAVVRWQAAHHRHRTGLVGKLLWHTVRSSPRTPVPSRSEDRVTALDWAALARCESGGNPRAVSSAGYYGLYQFSRSTWRAVGGSGLPSRAAVSEQTMRAQVLFRRSGSSPWPACGHHLFD